jgi:hypothetical protein
MFPTDVRKRLVTTNNPNSDITNSDLEMAGVLFQWLILEQVEPIKLQHANKGISATTHPQYYGCVDYTPLIQR